MDTLMLVVIALVALCYWGGRFCPKVLSSNKEMLLGVLVGMALCSFAGLKLEGFESVDDCKKMCPSMQVECNEVWHSTDCESVKFHYETKNNMYEESNPHNSIITRLGK
tara:strand:+ start:587 stop:913 length:327 start_codon:yes stop_codon:yes gene_type:complete